MDKRAITFLYNWATRQLLNIAPINTVTRYAVDGRNYYRKRRRVGVDLLIRLANLMLRPRFRVLPTREWHTHETRMLWLAHGVTPRVDRDSLHIPALPGRVLADLLGDPQVAEYEKLEAVAGALAALITLHHHWITMPDGRTAPFSHADARVTNVLYDSRSGRARWFDFETIHPPELPSPLRHTDDLRILICSAAALLPNALLPALACRVHTQLDRPSRQALVALLGQTRIDALFLAQTGCGPRTMARLQALFLYHT